MRFTAGCVLLCAAGVYAEAGSLGQSIKQHLRAKEGTNNIQMNFVDYRTVTYTGKGCSAMGGTAYYNNEVHDNEAGMHCELFVEFNNGLTCTGPIGTTETGGDYIVNHNIGPKGPNGQSCLKIASVSGSDAPGAPVWPCQDSGCWYEMSGTTINFSAGYQPDSQQNVEITFSWTSITNGAMTIKTTDSNEVETSKGSASSLEIGVDASVSYGPVSLSSSVKSSVSSSLSSRLHQQSGTTTTKTLDACPEGYNRWQYNIVIKGPSGAHTIATDSTRCVSGNYPAPICPVTICGSKPANENNCQCCYSEPGVGVCSGP